MTPSRLNPITLMEVAGHPIEGILQVNRAAEHVFHDLPPNGASPCIYLEADREIYDRIYARYSGDPWHIAVNGICSKHLIDINHPDAQLSPASPLMRRDAPPSIYSVDELIRKYSSLRAPNLLLLCAIGDELEILRSSQQTMRYFDGIFIRFMEDPGCSNAQVVEPIQAFLQDAGIRLRCLESNSLGEGVAFFSRPARICDPLPTYEGNLALGRLAIQSSLSQWSLPNIIDEAKGAVNGKITGACGFHTAVEDNASWIVDLGRTYALNEARIYNRLGAYKWRARSMKILLSENGSRWWEVHDQAGYSFGGADGRPLRVKLAPNCARYVGLHLTEHTCLHLDEVEIY
ncbi:discoidin domain-containing protein [Methylobacterium brachiatum]|uniref:Discoidin domain-containing protein n=1 Tax=Methylobacterium brachiatum TaxID=269660 RepID=A0ABV1R6R6_9HYPH